MATKKNKSKSTADIARRSAVALSALRRNSAGRMQDRRQRRASERTTKHYVADGWS